MADETSSGPLTHWEREAISKIGRASGKKPPFVMRDNHGRFYTPDGKRIDGVGFSDLIKRGALQACEDGLLPGHPQTYRLDVTAISRSQ